MNKKNFITLISLSAITLLFSACRYDKSELVYPPDKTPCDSVTVSYKTDIVNILSANCYTCHGSAVAGSLGSGIKLDTYTGVSTQAKFGALIQVVEHVPGFPFMPKNGNKLSDCNIAIIRKWISDGSPDN